MCGICGIFHYGTEQAADEPLVRRMATALTHRGPDDEGILLDGPVALGHRRLAIIDPAGSHQPMANEDQSVWSVANCEIYNFRQLADRLTGAGHRLRSRSDAEVIVHAYEEYGRDWLRQLDGMFALAVWDRRARRLTLARDPFGIKPLYLWDDGRCLRFASELKAFLADPTFPRDIDPVGLDLYLTFQFVPSPRTMFAAVQKVPPGHQVIVEGHTVRIERFTDTAPQPSPNADEAAAVEELQRHLRAAVERQMVSDVPLGALLSGGIDSATVVAIMREVSGRRVQTFTVGFAGGFANDELAAARRTAALLGTEHHEVVVDAPDSLDALAPIAWHLDEPIATPSVLPMWSLSRLAAGQVKVVLTGQGADEPWAGYRRYRGEQLGRSYRRLPQALRRGVVDPLVGRLPRAEALKRAVAALATADPAARFAAVYTVFSTAMKQALYRDTSGGLGAGAADVEALRYWQHPVAHLDPLAQQLYVETRFSLPDNLLLYGDKMAMAFSLEARVPWLDLPLMQFVENLPADLKLRGWAGHKYLYRQAVRRWLPDEISARRKIGFETPMDQWFQGRLAGMLRGEIATSTSACARYFNTPYIESLIDQHVARREDHTRPLFSLLMFEYWHRQFVDAPRPPH
ncbi:MAG: asparagine synthase (glutamine-hydrolyzing) [bacterium]